MPKNDFKDVQLELTGRGVSPDILADIVRHMHRVIGRKKLADGIIGNILNGLKSYHVLEDNASPRELIDQYARELLLPLRQQLNLIGDHGAVTHLKQPKKDKSAGKSIKKPKEKRKKKIPLTQEFRAILEGFYQDIRSRNSAARRSGKAGRGAPNVGNQPK